MSRPKWVSEWHVVANSVLAGLLIVAYVAHFFESALGEYAKLIIEGPSLPFLVLLYVALISSRLEMTRDHFIERLRALEENRLLEMAARLDPVLREVLGHYIDEAVSNVSSAVLEQKVTFNDSGVVPFLYRRLLLAYRGHAFCAITTPSKAIWRSDDVYRCMQQFIRLEKGTIRRVFILDCDLTPEQKVVINRHIGIGVSVALIRHESVEHIDQINFLVEQSGAFGWIALPGGLPGRQKLVATSSREETARMLDTFDRVWRHADVLSGPLE